MKTKIAVGILSATLAASTMTADAKTKKHYRARHHAPAAQTYVNPFMQNFMAMQAAMNPGMNPELQNNTRASRKAARASRHVRPATMPNMADWTGGFGGAGMIATARSYAGRNPTGRSRQWCGEFMAMVVRQSGGRVPEGHAKASSWAKLPRTTERVGAIAVMPHHVGIVTGQCEGGGVKIVSGNFGRVKVGEGCVSRSRIMAFVQP
jgi:hypothetical protein